jgi:hypothetical protein
MAFIPPNALNANIGSVPRPLQSYPAPTMSPGPTLWPQFGQAAVQTGGGLGKLLSPFDFFKQFPRVNGTNTVTIGGTSLATDQINLIFTSPLFNGGVYTLVCLSQAGDTVNGKTAERMAATINADPTLNAFGVTANVVGQTAVVNINWPGFVGLNIVLTTAIIVGTPTATRGTASWVGGSGPVVAYNNFTWTYLNQTFYFVAGYGYNLASAMVAQLCNGGAAIA